MIGEFAFTPSVFDEQAHPDAESWRDQLRELGGGLFPRTAPCPVMVADLYDGGWHRFARRTAESIRDDRARLLCQNLLTNMEGTLVRRPVAVEDWPEDDVSWCREALASHAIEPIDRIISCRAVQDILSVEGPPVRCISEIQANGFWQGISSQWDQPLTIASQIQAIRKLTLHAEFLCLITPHIRGTIDDETEFTRELIRNSHQRPTGFPAVEIEVHTEGPDKPASSDFNQRLGRTVRNISTELRTALPSGHAVRLIVWPKLLDRYLIAGVYTSTSGGTRVRSPRWGLSMQHIARRGDDREAKPPTSWSLLTQRQIGDQFQRYCTGTPLNPMHDTIISV